MGWIKQVRHIAYNQYYQVKTKHYLLMFAAIASIVLALSSSSSVYANLQEYSEQLAAINERITPAVVSVHVEAPIPRQTQRDRK